MINICADMLDDCEKNASYSSYCLPSAYSRHLNLSGRHDEDFMYLGVYFPCGIK